MATERAPGRTLDTLRQWHKEGTEQPIIAVYTPGARAADASWIFYQGNRAGDFEVFEKAIQPLLHQGQLDLRRDGPEGTWRAYPK